VAGTTVPTDDTAGYAMGCLFDHTDGVTSSGIYINEGSSTSCHFSLFSALTVLSVTAGTVGSGQAVIVDAEKHQDVVHTASLNLGATGSTVEVTASAAELNQLDGTILSAGAILVPVTPGTGISGGGSTICVISVEKAGTLYKTTILIDLTDLHSTGAGDIIGVDGTANPCYIGQITAAVNGTIIAGRVHCHETPAGGDTDIDLYSATEGTGVEDDAIAGLTETQLWNHGAWAAEEDDYLIAWPAANEYLYLVAVGATDADYTAGRFVIELWGA